MNALVLAAEGGWQEFHLGGTEWAILIFSALSAVLALAVGAYLFGCLMTLELYAKASGFQFLPSQFWASMPYIMAIVVLAVISFHPAAWSARR